MLLWLWGGGTIAQAMVIDRIVAKVNGEIITLSQVQEEGYPLLAKLQQEFQGEELRTRQQKVEQEVLEHLIDRTLQVQQARKLGFSVSEQELQTALQDILRQNNLTEEELKKILEEEDIDFGEYLHQIEAQILTSRLLNMEVRSKVRVEAREIEEYYQSHFTQYGDTLQFRVRHILFRASANGNHGTLDAARKNAQMVWEKIQAGEDFATLARRYSQDPSAGNGGDLGLLTKGEMLPAFEEAVVRLAVGAVSEPIQTKHGFHIIRVEEQKRGERNPLEAVRTEIEKVLINKKMQERYREWMQELRREAFIEFPR
jgi:peptidyl-prolyl cis-trans isomerase SurA